MRKWHVYILCKHNCFLLKRYQNENNVNFFGNLHIGWVLPGSSHCILELLYTRLWFSKRIKKLIVLYDRADWIIRNWNVWEKLSAVVEEGKRERGAKRLDRFLVQTPQQRVSYIIDFIIRRGQWKWKRLKVDYLKLKTHTARYRAAVVPVKLIKRLLDHID